MRYQVRHFQLDEFRCPDCGGVRIAAGLVLTLDILRSGLGLPLLINSGWRCEAHNREVGGAAQSRHLIGCAADLRCPEKMTIAAFANAVIPLFRLPLYECKVYVEKRFIHVAIPRATTDYWTGGDIIVTDHQDAYNR